MGMFVIKHVYNKYVIECHYINISQNTQFVQGLSYKKMDITHKAITVLVVNDSCIYCKIPDELVFRVIETERLLTTCILSF